MLEANNSPAIAKTLARRRIPGKVSPDVGGTDPPHGSKKTPSRFSQETPTMKFFCLQFQKLSMTAGLAGPRSRKKTNATHSQETTQMKSNYCQSGHSGM